MHSMSVREKPLLPWAIIKKDGCIEAAHCTCMAGLGEACTHIGAMLWAISAAVTIHKEKSVTDSKCYWLPCSANTNFMDSVRNADFTSSKQQKKFPMILTSLYDKTKIKTDLQDLQKLCHSIEIVCNPG